MRNLRIPDGTIEATTPNARASTERAGTLARDVYERLRSDILRAELLPGTKLRGELVRERYDVSGSPIREALTRLAAEGLVEREEQRGFFVARVSREELLELTKTRCWLEEIGLTQSIAQGGAAWEEKLLLAYHRMSRSPRWLDEKSPKSNPEWENLHNAFHEALLAACGSRWLLEFCAQLRDRSFRYRQLAAIERVRQPRREHEAIFKATLDRDTKRAVEALKAHYEHTTQITLERYAELP